MSNPAPVRAILQQPRRRPYLKLIALLKIGHGLLVLLLGISLLFLNARTRWMDFLSSWTADELLMQHRLAEIAAWLFVILISTFACQDSGAKNISHRHVWC